MRVLQQLLESFIEEQYSFEKIAANLIKRKLESLSIAISEEQLADIEAKLKNFEGDALSFYIDDNQLLGLSPTAEETAPLEIALSDGSTDVEGFLDQTLGNLSELIAQVVSDTADLLLKSLKDSTSSMLRHRRRQRRSFQTKLVKVWRRPLNSLEVLSQMAFEAGDEFNREFRVEAAANQDYVFEVLTRLHSRACQVASEILALLRSGHADGAHARWRSLHEIAVVGMFIKTAGNETAEKYLLHDAVESYRAAKQYQQYYARLGYDPISREELDRISSTYEQLVERFGDQYGEDYGWAAPLRNKQKPNFSDIEKEVELDHLRPFYKLASHNVHANPKGVFFKLGLYPESTDILIAGPSNTGLADPANGTAISLTQITVALLTTRSTIDTLVACSLLMTLERKISGEFLSTQQVLERAEQSSPSPRMRPKSKRVQESRPAFPEIDAGEHEE